MFSLAEDMTKDMDTGLGLSAGLKGESVNL